MSLTTTGFPDAIASRATIPNASNRETEGRTNTSHAAKYDGSSSPETCPVNITRSETPRRTARRRIDSSSGPPPTRRNFAYATDLAASTRFSIPLWETIRPTNRTTDSPSRIPWRARIARPSFSGRYRWRSTAFGITAGLYAHTARLVAAYVAVVTMIRFARRIV